MGHVGIVGVKFVHQVIAVRTGIVGQHRTYFLEPMSCGPVSGCCLVHVLQPGVSLAHQFLDGLPVRDGHIGVIANPAVTNLGHSERFDLS